MLKKLLAFVCLTLSLSANAAPVTWTLHDVVFEDMGLATGESAGTATGSFVYDAELNLYTDVDVATTFGPYPIAPFTYNELPRDYFGSPYPVSAMHVTFGVGVDSVNLSLDFADSLAVPGEMVAILPTSGEYSFYAFNRSISQGYVSASVVPLPATAWLFGSAMLGLMGVARRKKA